MTAPLGATLRRSHGVEITSYPTNLTRYEDIARWLVPQLGSSDFTLVAASFSGPLAIVIAAERPEGLKAVVIVASFARSPRRLPAFLAAVLYLLPLRSVTFIRLTQRLLVGKWGTKTFPEDFAELLRSIPRRTLVDRLRAVARVDVSEKLTEIRVPKLMILAAADDLVPRSQAAIFAAAGWTVEGIEGPHFLAFTRAEAVASKIKRFLDSQGPKTPDNQL